MNLKQTKNELQSILSGKSSFSYDPIIQTIAHKLRTSQKTSPVAEEKHQNKTQETAFLKEFANEHNLFVEAINKSDFISKGAEQKVYIKDNKHVIKLNDAIYYASWEDYFLNLLLHNYFFPDTAYQLLGFYEDTLNFHAVVKQKFIIADQITKLIEVKYFLVKNGFENTRNHDYYHPHLGIILEDLHDENVLTQKGMLYFIDTVFYIKPEVFWS